MSNTHHPLTPIAGVMLDTPTETAQFALGTIVHGDNGTEWIYVKASGAITQYDCVGINEDFDAYAMLRTLSQDSDRIGFAQSAFTTAYYGWVALRGSQIKVRVKASCAADAQLWTTASAGVLDDATNTGAEKIDGLVIEDAASNATQAEFIKASWPHVRES